MKSIIVILPYFGPFPKQFQFWLQSAYNNPTIDFLILTDNEISSKDNINIVNMTFDELRQKIQSKFDFSISLSSPYKLCDYRGAYGYIFEEYISSYDYWGFGDIDLVYGNIRSFLTDTVLSDFKIILGWGHLTLYRNIEECNIFFKEKIQDQLYYKDAFTKEKYAHFDEFLHGGMSDRWKYKHPELLWEEKPFDDIAVPRLSFNFRSFFNASVSQNLIFEYSGKNLYRVFLNNENKIDKEPTLYVHFQQRKFMEVNTSNTNEYLIIPNKYIDLVPISTNNLKKWTKPKTLERKCWNFKNKAVRRLKLMGASF